MQLRLVQTTDDLRNMVTSEDSAFLLDCGFPKLLTLLQLAERDEVVECAIGHYTDGPHTVKPVAQKWQVSFTC